MANNPRLAEVSKATQFSSTNQPPIPGGVNKKGKKHISTWIQDMMNDEEFETLLQHPTKGYIEYKGAPLKAIIQTAQRLAIGGDQKWAEWLAKHGWKQELDITSAGEKIEPVVIYRPEKLKD